jgi:hypothetical protein
MEKSRQCARTLTGWAHGTVGTDIEGFQLKRILSGVEVLLVKAGIGSEVRGHPQSRGR